MLESYQIPPRYFHTHRRISVRIPNNKILYCVLDLDMKGSLSVTLNSMKSGLLLLKAVFNHSLRDHVIKNKNIQNVTCHVIKNKNIQNVTCHVIKNKNIQNVT